MTPATSPLTFPLRSPSTPPFSDAAGKLAACRSKAAMKRELVGGCKHVVVVVHHRAAWFVLQPLQGNLGRPGIISGYAQSPKESNSCISQFEVNRHDHSELVIYPDRKSTRLNSSHLGISYAVFCLKKKKKKKKKIIFKSKKKKPQ